MQDASSLWDDLTDTSREDDQSHGTPHISREEQQTMTTNYSEADLLAKMAAATTLTEQSQWGERLNNLRNQRRESLAAEGSLDFDAMAEAPSSGFIFEPMTASASLGQSAGGLDWLDSVVPETHDDRDMSTAMQAEASVWYANLWEQVKAHPEEFAVQTRNAAHRTASRYGQQREAAASVFTDRVRHLHFFANGRKQAGEYKGGSPKQGDTATCHADGQKIQFFAGEWMHLKGGPSHNDVHPGSKKDSSRKQAGTPKAICEHCGLLIEQRFGGPWVEGGTDDPDCMAGGEHDPQFGTVRESRKHAFDEVQPPPYAMPNGSDHTPATQELETFDGIVNGENGETGNPKTDKGFSPSLSEGDSPEGDSERSHTPQFDDEDGAKYVKDSDSSSFGDEGLTSGGEGNAATGSRRTAANWRLESDGFGGTVGGDGAGDAHTLLFKSDDGAVAEVSIYTVYLPDRNITSMPEYPWDVEIMSIDAPDGDLDSPANIEYDHPEYRSFATEAEAEAAVKKHVQIHRQNFRQFLATKQARKQGIDIFDGFGPSPQDGPTNSFPCGNCGTELDRYRGESEVTCHKCGQEHNASGQRLRPGWRSNPSNYDSDIGDMEGYEMSFRDASKKRASESVEVASLPDCDICKHVKGTTSKAAYDGKTTMGSWANMCERCFATHGTGLGTGKGQRLVVKSSKRGSGSTGARQSKRASFFETVRRALGAEGDPGSTEHNPPSMAEGDTPEGDHSEPWVVQNPPAQDKSQWTETGDPLPSGGEEGSNAATSGGTPTPGKSGGRRQAADTKACPKCEGEGIDDLTGEWCQRCDATGEVEKTGARTASVTPSLSRVGSLIKREAQTHEVATFADALSRMRSIEAQVAGYSGSEIISMMLASDDISPQARTALQSLANGPEDSCSNCEHTRSEHGGDAGPCDACGERPGACGGFEAASKEASRRHAAEGDTCYCGATEVEPGGECLTCGEQWDWQGNSVGPGGNYFARRTAAEGDTCAVCGDKIARDDASEEPNTWHHDNGEKHDHEAKPGKTEGQKESRRRTASSCSEYPEGETNEDGADEPYCEFHRSVNGHTLHEMNHGLIRVHDSNGGYVDSADSMEAARGMTKAGGRHPFVREAAYPSPRADGRMPQGSVRVNKKRSGLWQAVQISGVGVVTLAEGGYEECRAAADAAVAKHGGDAQVYDETERPGRSPGSDTTPPEPMPFSSSRKQATYYCTTHDVYVGDGNRETHSGDDCNVEQRKAKDSSRKQAAAIQRRAAGSYKGIVIHPDKRIEERILNGLSDLQSAVQGYIEPVDLSDGVTMWVNEEGLYKFTKDDVNWIAADVASLGGQPQFMFGQPPLLGPVVLTGFDPNSGENTDLPAKGKRWVQRVAGEAGGKWASRKQAAASTYEVKRVHGDQWIAAGESTEEAGEVIKSHVTGSDEEFWLMRNNFNGSVTVFAYHGAMKGIDSSMPPRNMGSYKQFYGEEYREASRKQAAPWEWRGEPGVAGRGQYHLAEWSKECLPGGSGICDGFKENGGECGCFCHDGATNLPQTVDGVKAMHDEFYQKFSSKQASPNDLVYWYENKHTGDRMGIVGAVMKAGMVYAPTVRNRDVYVVKPGGREGQDGTTFDPQHWRQTGSQSVVEVLGTVI